MNLAQRVNAIHAATDITALRAEYEKQIAAVTGDAAAVWAVQEATCARKERLEYLSEMDAANARQARRERCEDDDDGPYDPTRASGLYEPLEA